MGKKILDHYLEFSTFTNPGCYKKFLQNLPDDIKTLGKLIRTQIIPRVVLKEGNTGFNRDLKYGDMNKVPWWRLKCEDDILTTASSMIAELLRRDEKGFILERTVDKKIIVTCRHTAILTASVLKSKGIPCRVRSGFAPYFCFGENWDHWINQYWDKVQKRWVNIDVDGSLEIIDFDPYDMQEEKFNWAATSWLKVRKKELNPNIFIHGGKFNGLMVILWAVIYDFHSLMNNEILYTQMPSYIGMKFNLLTEKDFEEIDELAKLMLEPDKNFDELVKIWNTKKRFRILNSPLIGDDDHIKWK